MNKYAVIQMHEYVVFAVFFNFAIKTLVYLFVLYG